MSYASFTNLPASVKFRVPRGYFGTDAEEVMTALRKKALTDRRSEFFRRFPFDQEAGSDPTTEFGQ
jgi:hypothetical protein